MEDKNFILEFIEVYRSLPALWNVKSKEYSNRNIKNEQYEVLLTKYKEKFPEATKKEMCQKINCLRTGYRRELKRISALERSGSGLSEENDGTLYYFDALKFLRDSKEPCSSRNSCAGNNAENNETPRKRKKPDPSEDLITLAAKRLMEPKDEFKTIANVWANKLKNLDNAQRKFAEKFVNDILFEADMGTLHRNAMTLHLNTRSSTPHSYTPEFTDSNSGNSFRRSSTVPVPMVSGLSSGDESDIIYVETSTLSPQDTNSSWDPPQPQAQQQEATTNTAHYLSNFK